MDDNPDAFIAWRNYEAIHLAPGVPPNECE
jgi:hypothetical protein